MANNKDTELDMQTFYSWSKVATLEEKEKMLEKLKKEKENINSKINTLKNKRHTYVIALTILANQLQENPEDYIDIKNDYTK